MSFKVWIEIEEYDEEADSYQNLDLPFASTAEFDSEDEAYVFAHALQDKGNELLEA